AQLPRAASCQMFLSPVTSSCHMPCCKNSPLPKCAMKVQPPQDLISSAAPIPDFSAQKVIATLVPDSLSAHPALQYALFFLAEQLEILFSPADVPTRGPPHDIHLLFA